MSQSLRTELHSGLRSQARRLRWWAMQVYKVHKKRVLAFATAVGTVVLLVAVAFLNHASGYKEDWEDYGDTGYRETEIGDGNDTAAETSDKQAAYTANETWKSLEDDRASPDEDAEQEEEGLDVGAWESEPVVGGYELEEDDEDEDNSNGVFRDGDFDTVPVPNSTLEDGEIGSKTPGTALEHSQWHERVVDRRLQAEPPGVSWKVERDSLQNLRHLNGMSIVEDGLFWSEDLERQTPKGLGDLEVRKFQNHLRQLEVSTVEEPTWNRCGRPKNQYLTLADGSHVCARYRAPHDYLVQGELMSFYLGRLLGLDNIPVVVLSKVDPMSRQWRKSLSSSVMVDTGWDTNETVALIQWIDGLGRDKMPEMVLDALETGYPVSANSRQLTSMSTNHITELLQWSDLILFDYITGNYDRVASMQDAADKESKPEILKDTIHNLAKCRTTGGLWLIDNESGLLDAYSLMYSKSHPSQGQRFLKFQQRMLRTMCIFRRKTVRKLRLLNAHPAAPDLLLDSILTAEPLFNGFHDIIGEVEFKNHFRQRIREVHQWIQRCTVINGEVST